VLPSGFNPWEQQKSEGKDMRGMSLLPDMADGAEQWVPAR